MPVKSLVGHRPTSVSVAADDIGDSQMYDLGTMTFGVPTVRLTGSSLSCGCFRQTDQGNAEAYIPIDGVRFG